MSIYYTHLLVIVNMILVEINVSVLKFCFGLPKIMFQFSGGDKSDVFSDIHLLR